MNKTLKIIKYLLFALIGGAVTAGVLYGLIFFNVINIDKIVGKQDDNVFSSSKENVVSAEGVKKGSSSENELSAEQIYDIYNAAVVHIEATVVSETTNFFGFTLPERSRSQGSGFFIGDKGYLVTNAHVVDGAQEIGVILDDKTRAIAKLVGIDVSTDLAVLKIEPNGYKFKVLELANSSKVRVGSTVYAIGNPFGLDRSMSQGITSAIGREIQAPNGFPIRNVIQTDAAVNPGNSGGPLINAEGDVIGVTSQIASQTGNNAGIAFAVPSNTVKKIVQEIITKGSASHAWLGISGYDLDTNISAALNLKEKEGIMVAQVEKDSPADKAAIKGGANTLIIGRDEFIVGGDIIVAIDGEKVGAMQELMLEIDKKKAGEKVKVTISRGGRSFDKEITLGERPNTSRN